jgi:hypothetical protein
MLFTNIRSGIAIMLIAATASSYAQVWDVSKVFEPGTEIPAKSELAKCVDTAAELLGINMDMKTEPALLLDILDKDMHLQDMHSVIKMFANDLKQEQSLRPMLEQVREGITSVHPAVGVALCTALADTTTVAIFSAPNAAVIKRSIHHMYLLEKIVARLADDRVFMVQVQKHVQDTVKTMTRHKSGIGHTYDLFKAAGLFGVAKSFSINGAMNDYKTFRERGYLTPDEVEGRKQGLTINVLEATATDFFHGFFSNVKVGYALAKLHPSTIEVVGENRTIHYVNDMDYARLYETWNLAFITGNLDFPNLLYPKLLIPSVILADANSYLYRRVLALWLSINIYLMSDLTGQKHVTFTGSKDLATLWGKVNLRYTNYLQANKDQVQEDDEQA